MVSRTPGVVLQAVDVGGAATVAARRGGLPTLLERVHEHFGLVLPESPRFVSAAGIDCVWAGPQRWLFEGDDADLARRLHAELGAAASVVDQSSSRLRIDLSGTRVRELLAKGVPLDLDEFRAGDVALTVAHHVDVMLRQLTDEPRYRLGVPRSFADGVRVWLEEAAAEYGCGIRQQGAAATG